MISKDQMLTNCQNKINTMSSNASTIKSIFLSLSIAVVAAYYGSSFFGFFLKENDTNFVISVTVIFVIMELLINFVFTFLLTRNFSIERGYIALYYYCDKLSGKKSKNPELSDRIDAKFVGYQYISLYKYKKKSNDEKCIIEKRCTDYLSTVNNNVMHKTGTDLIMEYNNSSMIKHTDFKECLKSPSIYGFSIANLITLLCILALFFTRLYC